MSTHRSAAWCSAPGCCGNLVDPSRFLSYASRDSRESIEKFRARPDFGPMIEGMRRHLDDMQISTLALVLGEDP